MSHEQFPIFPETSADVPLFKAFEALLGSYGQDVQPNKLEVELIDMSQLLNNVTLADPQKRYYRLDKWPYCTLSREIEDNHIVYGVKENYPADVLDLQPSEKEMLELRYRVYDNNIQVGRSYLVPNTTVPMRRVKWIDIDEDEYIEVQKRFDNANFITRPTQPKMFKEGFAVLGRRLLNCVERARLNSGHK